MDGSEITTVQYRRGMAGVSCETTFNDIISEEIEFITDNRRWENLKDMVKE